MQENLHINSLFIILSYLRFFLDVLCCVVDLNTTHCRACVSTELSESDSITNTSDAEVLLLDSLPEISSTSLSQLSELLLCSIITK
jgi:hypothetical protein